MTFSAVIVAAGSGLRAGPGAPKAWRHLGGKPLLRWSVEAMAAAGARRIVVVVAEAWRPELEAALAGVGPWTAAIGGETRADSVKAGLAAIDGPADEPVLIHDAARPFLNRHHIAALLAALADADGTIPALAVADTLKRSEGAALATVSRGGLWRAQTPQAFRRDRLLAAFDAWPADREPTDDASLVEADGGVVRLVTGDPMLMKLTYPEDFALAERLAGSYAVTRTGQGIDAHRWEPGEAVWLCGVRVPHDRRLSGHSDADAGLHALTDALLGAIGEGDIGDHFPPSDPQWKGAASDRFLAHARDLVAARGGRILNVDVTLICETPKIGPHRQAMRERLADLLRLPLDRVSVKATTMEGMGFTGRGEGLVAQAVASVETPS